MSTSVLNRVRSMGRQELSFRLTVAARTHLQRVAALVRPPRWNRAHLAEALTPQALEGPVGEAVARQDWSAAHRRLLDRLRSRPARFVLNPGSSCTLRRAVLSRWPDASLDAAARGERVIAGDYDLLCYQGLRFDLAGEPGSIDWCLDPVHDAAPPRSFWADVPYLEPRYGDHKIVWELNRHQHWLTLSRARWLTGHERYGLTMRQQLSDWLDANPPLIGVNWASMLELGFRSFSWLWAMHALLVHDDGAGEPWLVDMLVGLDRQLLHVEQNLSYYFSPNTHLTGEALALYVAGCALPELARSTRWAEVGRRILLDEISKQISRDGGHAERSTHYHRYTLDFYLLALMTAEQVGDEHAAAAFRDAVARMARYLAVVAGADGRIPQIGDDDGGSLWPLCGREPKDVRDTLAVAAIVVGEPDLARWGVPEEAFWLTWSTHGEEAEALWAKAGALGDRPAAPMAGASAPAAGRQLHTAVFPETGYVVIRDPAGAQLVFDVGVHGYLNSGHAHADALAITLAANGHPLLVDPGTATYTMDPALRDQMRSSVSHNTLTLDGVPPSVPAGPFHWRTSTDARLDAWRGNVGFGWAEGSHDGYAGAQYRRSVVHVVGGGTLIVDQVIGHAQHVAQLHWHFDPAWEVACESARRLRARHPDGTIAWLVRDGGSLWLVTGDTETGLGWYSPRYGQLSPTWAARITRKAVAPFAMVSWVGTGQDAPSLERLTHEGDPASEPLAVRVSQGGTAWTTLLRPGEPAVRSTRSCAAADYQTNARLLQYALRGHELTHLAVADATHALSLSDGLLSVAADDHVDDLYVTIGSGVLELSASHPLRLHLQGSALRGIRVARLNGRELPVTFRGRRDSLVISASAWAGAEQRTWRPESAAARVEPRAMADGASPNLQQGTVLCVE